ncbi:YdeI/OmpD-associated family protein [Paenibacillus koleovorans]|uniref:YdeI/OmpD-associated family protein n=1 Tax=Paenibacillus koleovorans TaxID=121608 RepID=UPI000FDC8CD9|nr:YdeI/OmpD-associated family protein [Paenibacillus koleovorans]
MKEKAAPLPIMMFENQEIFEAWLARHYDSSPGLRLQIAKKGSGLTTVNYTEALDVALCYGWIDSQKEAMDEKTWLQRFTPRGKKSIWSVVNKDKVAVLIEAGRMKPSGQEAIDIAKRNGQWDSAYEPQSTAAVPEDFAALLDLHPKAKATFEGLKKSERYSILFRLAQAKKPETKEKRMREFVEQLEGKE